MSVHETLQPGFTSSRMGTLVIVPPAERPVYEAAKRFLDVTTASAVLIAALPLWIAVALVVKLTSAGPVLYVHQRCGKDGRPFACYKFRTMTSDAEQQRSALLAHNEMHGPVFKIRNDPRITSAGWWLRKTSLDELPQLLNVLRGDMSIVGPRPPLPREVDLYTERQFLRLSVKPGLTCLWQVSGRNLISNFDEWVTLDLMYIERRGFRQDLMLILRTIPAVLSTRGAS